MAFRGSRRPRTRALYTLAPEAGKSLVLTWPLVPCALMFALSLSAVDTAAVEQARALAQKIQAHHLTVRDMKGRFVQTYSSGLLGRTVVEQGTLAIKRPGRML